MLNRKLYALIFMTSFVFVACRGPKEVIYFQDKDGIAETPSFDSMQPRPATIIQQGDILDIKVTSISSILNSDVSDPVSIFNSGGTAYSIVATAGRQAAASGSTTLGYLVDANGEIDYPVLGKVRVEGYSIEQAKDYLRGRLGTHLKDPVVNVRIINYKITVIGETGTTGVVLAPNHTINLLEAVAASGDIPITGRKDNILLVRETNDQHEFVRLDMTSKDIFKSPYYYLKQNDILYIEPNRIRRQQSNEFLRFYLPVITSLIGTALTVWGLSQRFN